MEQVIEEDLNSFNCSFTFENSEQKRSLNDISHKLERYKKLCDLKFNLYADGSHICSLESIEDVAEELDDYSNDAIIKLTLNYAKESNTFTLFEPSYFIATDAFESKRLLWESVISNFQELIYLDDNEIKQSIEFTNNKANNISSLNKFNDIDDKPRSFSLLSNKTSNNLILSNEFKVISSFTFMKNICSEYDFNGYESFSFEGYSNFLLPKISESELLNCNTNFLVIYDWLTQDKHVIAKLGILRNILSLSKSVDLEVCFNNDLINALFSNFQIYLKENISQYFDVKNKVSEFIFELSNKSSGLLEEYVSKAKNILLAVLSYFFTVVVLTTIDKNNTVNTMFSLELGGLSLIFIGAALFLVFESRKELTQKSYDIVELMTEIKARYNLTLSQQELDEMFNSPTLNRSMERIKVSKFHHGVGVILVLILLAIILGICKNLP